MAEVREVDVAIVGAGLVGSLLAVYLSYRGMRVDVFERRPDMRKATIDAGRSINLNISCRGLTALERVGALEEVLEELVPMHGRMMHSRTGELTYQPYGKDDTEYGNSVSRAGLNKVLMNKAEASELARFHFSLKAKSIDFKTNTITFVDDDGHDQFVSASLIVGTDGSGSSVRRTMMSGARNFQETMEMLDYGYKELYIPPATNGGFRIEKNALHIWPRGSFMIIALPNFDGSFTVTLFLPFEGEKSFEKLVDEDAVQAFFEEEFPDLIPLVPDFLELFFDNPTGHMETIKCYPWNVGGRAVLMGDAAHGIVPFFGQGMNCGFEDLTIFDTMLTEFIASGRCRSLPSKDSSSEVQAQWEYLLNSFVMARKPNCDAIADMAVENFIEMRDKVADPRFLLHKSVEKVLAQKFPGQYLSRYQLVTFTNVPYTLAHDAGIVCDAILEELCQNIQSADDVDMEKAKTLIEEKLSPMLEGHPALLAVTG